MSKKVSMATKKSQKLYSMDDRLLFIFITLSVICTVFSQDPLSISVPHIFYFPTIGSLVVLECVVSGSATSVRWYFDGNQITVTSSKYSNGNATNPSLYINNITLSDAGSYICEASDGVSTVSSGTIRILIAGPTFPSVYIPLNSYSGTTEGQITIPCTVSSSDSQLQSISWTFNDGETSNIITSTTNTAKYSGMTISSPSLTIQNLAASDAGSYTCTATNTVGTGSSNPTQLSVIGITPIKELY